MYYEERNISQLDFQKHQDLKNKGLALKQVDKDSADASTFVITADTEALLTSPNNDANIMFFRSKLNLHNFTFYDLKTREVMNYLWTEINGDIESSNFTSCYIDYLTGVLNLHPDTTTIIIWSDGCTYQNRCNILSSALLTFAVRQNVTIFHKYLEVGHTHMECDSVHANIERAVKHARIHLPTDYINLIESARKVKPGKYGVKYVEFSFFKDYRLVCDIKSVKPTKGVGAPYVVNIRQFRYKPDGQIDINLTYSDANWGALPHNITLRYIDAPQLYTTPVKISYAKYNHLQEIKMTIPKEFHHFYDNIDHHDKANTK